MMAGGALVTRHADVDDIAAMRELAWAAYRPFVERMCRQPAPMTADYAEIVDSGDAWVAVHGDDVVGLLVLEVAADHLLVDNVAVVPHAQGLGVGSTLLRLAEEQARMRGLRQVRLYTNAAMHENLAYYPRRGYRETHRGTQDGYHRVFFTKDLDR